VPLADTSVARHSVAAALTAGVNGPDRAWNGDHSDRLLGTIVHRLIHRLGLPDEPLDDETLATVAAHLGRRDERLEADANLGRRAAAVYRDIWRHADVRAIYQSGEVFHEVPFTLRTEERILRGTIDCLVREGARMTLLDFKTGRADAAHEQQLSIYRAAVTRMFPGCAVDARLVYAGADRT
jgi:ATP-dependent exoDNAse (exonuclease V) beta subunit